MPRYAQLVVGPAGSGKSAYCSHLTKHCSVIKRTVNVVNLDPAAEYFDYPVMADIRELIHIDDVMEDKSLSFGPNGGLIFCMEYLANNFEWLQEQLYEEEDDYILFDCPDAQFLVDAAKFVSGSLCALSTMINLEVPHVNVLTKMDLLSKKSKKNLNRYLEPELNSLLMEEFQEEEFGIKFKSINKAIAQLLDDFSLVHFIPLDYTKEESINDLLIHIDSTIQYGEDLEPKEIRDEIHEADDKDQEENYNN